MKTLQEHHDVLQTWVDRLPADQRPWVPSYPDRVQRLLTELSTTHCRDKRRRTLAKLRDAICPLFTVPQFASIKAYELWVTP